MTCKNMLRTTHDCGQNYDRCTKPVSHSDCQEKVKYTCRVCSYSVELSCNCCPECNPKHSHEDRISSCYDCSMEEHHQKEMDNDYYDGW